MTLILDAGALIALENNDRAMWRRLDLELREDRRPVTHGGVVAQAWRTGTGRQARLARALQAIDVVGLDRGLGKEAGRLLRLSRTSDAIDAAVVVLAAPGDQIVTSDPEDIDRLVFASGLPIDIVPV